MGALAKRFGDKVRQLRAERHWTQAQLAEAAHISDEWVRRIEGGGRSPSFDIIDQLAVALGVDAVELFAPAARPSDTKLLNRSAHLTSDEIEWLIEFIGLFKNRP